MNLIYKKGFLLFSLTLFTAFYSQLAATHIVGGELNYKYLGNNNYEIRLTVYRDCYNGIPQFDDPAYLGIFDVFNNFISVYNLPFLGKDTVQPYIVSPCLDPPLNVCYERTTYITTINLPAIPGGYQLVYQRCCRNVTISNLQSPDDQGITIYATIPDKIPVPVNSNPVFKNWPPPFICQSYPFVFDHSAIDPDGDVIRYELCAPLNGALGPSPQPNPPENPPYMPVTWALGYGINDMLGGTIPLKIDSMTGIMTATPSSIGQFVVGVRAKEYRNGYYIGATKRDFQINVVACPGLTTAYFPSPIKQCGSTPVQFQNFSAGAIAYLWNFGDPGTLADTSHAVNPSYTYTSSGTYTVTLIARSDSILCSDTITGTVIIFPDQVADFSFTLDTCAAVIHLNDTASAASNASLVSWNFGDATTSTVHDPEHTYNASGTYNITLISTSPNGCKDTVVKTITVTQAFNATINSSINLLCHDSCTGKASAAFTGGTPPVSYQWNDAAHQNTAMAGNLCAGTYTVTVTDSNGCVVHRTVTLSQPTAITHTIESTDAYCEGLCIGTATSAPAGGTPPYSYSWNDPAFQTTVTASSLCPGAYIVNVTDANGCKIKDSVIVLYSSYIPPVVATVNHDTAFIGQQIELLATHAGYSYQWIPASGLNNPQIYNPVANPDSGFYTYIVVITDDKGCTNTDTVSFYVKNVECIEPELYIPNAFSPNGDGVNDVIYVHGNTIMEMHFVIYDRWGVKVFESNEPSFGWDGSYKGKKLTPAVYDYYAEIKCYNNEKFSKKGNITLLK
ncbi:MAG: PKD domain-containing protein [Bacteroidia bacterium]